MPAQPSSPRPGRKGAKRTPWLCGALALGLLGLLGGPVQSGSCTPDPSCQPKFGLNRYDKGVKTAITNCQTNESSSPCAWADVATKPENFLACSLETTGPIALCYYSGVPGFPLLTPGCTFAQGKKAANCDCYKISKDQPAGATYSYVLITSILNKQVYEETITQCGVEGEDCLNAANLADSDKPEAPVCSALHDRSLFRGADLISTFSPILVGTKGIISHACPTWGGTGNLYAGCMTAPCKETGKIDVTTGLPIVKCTCPTYKGPNQVGNPQIEQGNYSCSPTPRVWSSAYSTASDLLPTVP
jgi:hypothetical protein